MAATTGATIFCARWTDPGKKGVRKMKIIRQGKTAILLTAALFIGLFAIFPAQSLASESAADRRSLDSENHNAYLVGYEDGTVRPQKAITRAEVATIFFRLLTEDGRDRYLTTENDFSDVAADASVDAGRRRHAFWLRGWFLPSGCGDHPRRICSDGAALS